MDEITEKSTDSGVRFVEKLLLNADKIFLINPHPFPLPPVTEVVVQLLRLPNQHRFNETWHHVLDLVSEGRPVPFLDLLVGSIHEFWKIKNGIFTKEQQVAVHSHNFSIVKIESYLPRVSDAVHETWPVVADGTSGPSWTTGMFGLATPSQLGPWRLPYASPPGHPSPTTFPRTSSANQHGMRRAGRFPLHRRG